MTASIISKEIVGINITDNFLKLCCIRISPAKKRVIGLKYFDTRSMEDNDISENIKQSLKQWKVKNTKIVLSISSPLIMTKNIEIPSLNQQEIDGIINLQVNRYTPYARGEIILDYINIGVYKRNYTKVLLTIATRDAIKKPMEILNKTNLKIDKVLLASEGLGYFCSNALKLKPLDPPVGLIHLDSDFTDFNIIFKNKVIFIRNISIGVNHLLREERDYQSKFMEELKKSLESYQSEEIDRLPNLFIFTGNVERLKHFEPLINQQLNTPTKLLPYINDIPLSDEARHMVSVTSCSFLDAIGPLLYLDKMKVNLIPEEIKVRRALESKSREIVSTGILGITIFALIGCIFLSKIYYKSAYLKKLTLKYAATNKEAEDIEGKFAKIRILKNYLLSAGKPLEILTEICNIISPDIYFSNITVEESLVTLKGTSTSMGEVFILVGNLENSKYFQSVKTEYTKKKIVDNKDLTDFQINFLLEGIK